jgi:hypothetical protein
MKKSILLASSALLTAGLVASNASAADVEVYGQVNKGVVYFDDGTNEDFVVVDNDFSSTRFGLRGSKDLGMHGLTASFLIEGELQGDNASNAFDADSVNTDSDASSYTERHTRVGLAGNWGALFVGKTSTATDGVAEIDLTPTADVSGSTASRIGGGIEFQGGTGVTIGDVVDSLDGLAARGTGDRYNTVRFDTPIFNGVQARAAVSQGGDLDGAVYYNGKIDAFEVAAGLGYVQYNNFDNKYALGTDNGEIESQYVGSASIKHDNGISGTIAYGRQDVDNYQGQPNFYYLKAGYEFGNAGVSAEYGEYNDMYANATDGVAETEAEVMGISTQYNLGNGVSVAGYWKNFDLKDNVATDYDEVDLLGVNMRVKF